MMRSTSSPRAVSISTGIAERARMRRSASKPSIPGKHDIEDDKAVFARECQLDTLFTSLDSFDVERLRAEILCNELAEFQVVVDYQYSVFGGRHARPPASRNPAAGPTTV